jgi:hypothetical protein
MKPKKRLYQDASTRFVYSVHATIHIVTWAGFTHSLIHHNHEKPKAYGEASLF